MNEKIGRNEIIILHLYTHIHGCIKKRRKHVSDICRRQCTKRDWALKQEREGEIRGRGGGCYVRKSRGCCTDHQGSSLSYSFSLLLIGSSPQVEMGATTRIV